MPYSAVTAGEKDADSPITVGLIDKLDGNVEGAFEGNAPFKLNSSALDLSVTAGNYPCFEYDSGTYTSTDTSLAYTGFDQYRSIAYIQETGTYRVAMRGYRSPFLDTGRLRVYRNGAAYGAVRTLSLVFEYFTEDLAFTAGDEVEVRFATNGDQGIGVNWELRAGQPYNLVKRLDI